MTNNYHFPVTSLVVQMAKNLPAMWEIWVQSLGWEDPWGGGNGNPLQYSYLGNPMDRGAGWPAVHGVCKESDTTEQVTLSLL